MKKLPILSCLAAVIIILAAACSGAPATAPVAAQRLPESISFLDSSPLPLAPELSKDVLANGLTYYVRYNGNPGRRVTMYLVVGSGSADEADDQLGYAHFIEHMAFNGTASFPKNELVNYLRSIGMRFGAEINAYTTRENTVYMLEMPSDNPLFFNTGLKVLKEWATAISFDPEEVEKEKGVILEELRLRLGPADQALKRELPVLLGESRHAYRDPIGTEESVRSATAESLGAFYEEHYRPERMAVIIVGDINPKNTVKAVKETFDFPGRPGGLQPRIIHPVTPAADMSFVASISEDFDQPLIQYQKIVPYQRESTIGEYYSFLTNRITVELIRQRLANLTRGGEMAWNAAYFSSDYFFGMTRVYNFAITSLPGRELAAFGQLATEVERIRQFGFTQTEIQRVIDLWRVWLSTLDIEDQDLRSASFADEYVRNFMYGEPVPGIVNERVYIRNGLDRLNAEDFLAEARSILRSDEGFVSVRTRPGPGNDQLTLKAFDAALEAARNQQLSAFSSGIGQTGLFDGLPAPGSIVSETRLADDITELRLANGARVLLRPSLADRDTVKFLAVAKGGWASLPVEDHTAASLAPALLQAAGLGDIDGYSLDNLTAPYRMSLNWGFDEAVRLISGETIRKDLEVFLRLVYLTAVEPGKDEAAFRQLRGQLSNQLDAYTNDPAYRFQNAWNRHLYADNPRLGGLSGQAVETLDLERLRRLSIDGLANAADFTYILVGDFDLSELRPMIAQHLGAIPAGEAADREAIAPLVPRQDDNSRIDYRLARENRATVRMVWSAPAEWSHEGQKRLEFLSYALNNRLLDALREDLGATYVVTVQADFQKQPVSQFQVVIAFDTHPDKVDELIAEVDAELARLKKTGLDAMYVQQIRAAVSRSIQGRMGTNDFWLGRLLQAIMQDQDFAVRERELASVQFIDNKGFLEVANQVFLDEQRFVYVLLPQER